MVTEPLRVLLIGDDEADYLVTHDMLAAQERARFELEWCAARSGMRSAISGRWTT